MLAAQLNLRSAQHVPVKQAIDRFAPFDVLVNNAGHGVAGAVEEASDAEVLDLYETNVFGLICVARVVLPYLRTRWSGHIVSFSSIGGLVGFAGWGIYNFSKFAVIGLSEALASNPHSHGETKAEFETMACVLVNFVRSHI